MIACGGCEAAVNIRITCGRVKLKDCGALLCGSILPVKLKWADYKSHSASNAI